MNQNKVLVIADIVDSFPEINDFDKQEWENRKSIDYLLDTIYWIGYDPILIEPKKSKSILLNKIKDVLDNSNTQNAILFNLVEGFRSRNREGYVPAIGEFFGVAYTGSDSYAQNISLDKYLTKLIVKQHGIPTKKSIQLEQSKVIPANLQYPLFLKPNGEGSSLGIMDTNIVNTNKELEFGISELLNKFESILVEEYLTGEDLTVGIFGNFPIYESSSVAKIQYSSKVYSENIKTKDSMPETLSFSLEKKLEKKVQKDSIEICKMLKVSGYARLDWKCDESGNPFFLEINLTPGLSHFYSSLPICFEENLGNYSDLIKKILQKGYENYNINKIFDYGKI